MHAPGVRRWFCRNCGTALAAQYDYLPDQTYVPVGLFDQVDRLVPQSQSHTSSRLCWLDDVKACPESRGSGSEGLNAANA